MAVPGVAQILETVFNRGVDHFDLDWFCCFPCSCCFSGQGVVHKVVAHVTQPHKVVRNRHLVVDQPLQNVPPVEVQNDQGLEGFPEHLGNALLDQLNIFLDLPIELFKAFCQAVVFDRVSNLEMKFNVPAVANTYMKLRTGIGQSRKILLSVKQTELVLPGQSNWWPCLCEWPVPATGGSSLRTLWSSKQGRPWRWCHAGTGSFVSQLAKATSQPVEESNTITHKLHFRFVRPVLIKLNEVEKYLCFDTFFVKEHKSLK